MRIAWLAWAFALSVVLLGGFMDLARKFGRMRRGEPLAYYLGQSPWLMYGSVVLSMALLGIALLY